MTDRVLEAQAKGRPWLAQQVSPLVVPCRIVDVPDDLSWALFAYSGAASAAGQSYTGAVLCTPDGRWPAASAEERINAALR